MKLFLNTVQPFTRSVRLLTGTWRWIEASPSRRIEVGMEEIMAFIGNRVSRILARLGMDTVVTRSIVLPLQQYLIVNDILGGIDSYHPIAVCICLGILRAILPYIASFMGSYIGRKLTRQFVTSTQKRWLPTQKVMELNLTSDDCCETDEIDQTADLYIIARGVAIVLGKVQQTDTTTAAAIEKQYETLSMEGFQQVGVGCGGYAVYQKRIHHNNNLTDADDKLSYTTILLHVTPYGPSILDVLPFYVVIETDVSFDRRHMKWSNSLTATATSTFDKNWRGPDVLEGYCYQGAFFSPHHFAEMKDMFDKQLTTYEAGCRILPRAARKHNEMSIPTDLPSLKKFLDTGKRNRKRKKNKKEYNELQKIVSSIAVDISRMDKKSRPKGVILYFEGLDCSGKSSTGGLVQQVLEQAGYDVGMRQYNRPPTAEQRTMDWMDRFEVPGGGGGGVLTNNFTVELTPKETIEHDNNESEEFKPTALVWDRGPAGDFVYGGLNNLSASEKARHYDEFIAFDHHCQENGILFLKLLFVTNRDSIASTLGKRLAQKHMARDLKSWLRACTPSSSEKKTMSLYSGLDTIAGHIDPTDFIAFNNYERNLHQFVNFALNTETKENPWVVVNTGNRYDARKSLLNVFRSYLHTSSSKKGPVVSTTKCTQHAMDMNTMMTSKVAMSQKHRQLMLISIIGLILLVFIYLRKLTAE